MRKKILAISLVAAMMTSLCGCGKKTENETTAMNGMQTTEEVLDIEEGFEDVDSGEYMVEDVCDGAAESAENGMSQTIYEDACGYPLPYEEQPGNTNEYDYIQENSWMSVETTPLSTFAADVDTASYTQIRSCIQNGYEIDPSMVRIEEMLNYFHYDYTSPKGDDKFAVYTEYMDCPWNEDTKLALVSMNTAAIDFKEAPESNIVFLIDTSGSMFDANKLPLVQKSMCMLAENLTAKDRVSIVTYAGSDEVVLEGVSGDQYYEISSAIENLEAWGSTNGSAGIETAYAIAEKYFIKGGNNRVILCTDGDLNVGVTSEGALEKLISEKKESGVFLSVIGVGYGNYKDNKLEILADKGNGNYAYIDSVFEAKKALVDEFGANMQTVAKDVKLQVEFNQAQVKGYRLIGYENRVMAAEDFADDTKDGGEMGSGHCVTALYEIALVDSAMEIHTPDLKYDTTATDGGTISGTSPYEDELFTVSIRYKEPDGEQSSLVSYVCDQTHYNQNGSDNLRFAAGVAAFGMLLKESAYCGNADVSMVLELAKPVADKEEDAYKQEFCDLVEAYK